MRDLVAAIAELERDRRAVEQTTAQLIGTRGDGNQARLDFEHATQSLATTVEIVCDEHPLLYRVWETVSLPGDVYFGARGELFGRPGRANAAIATLQRQLFEALQTSYEANVELHQDLDTSSVWDLSPLIDLTLEDLEEDGPTVWYRAAQERLKFQESMSVAAILSIVTGVLEMGGAFVAAEPPVLLALAAASAVLSAIDNAQEFFMLRTKDRAHLASLDPQLALSTEPSYFGFYVSIAFSLLDIKGVRDAIHNVRLARYGHELDDAVEAYIAAH